MWIRSQRKDMLLQIGNLTISQVNCKSILYVIRNNDYSIGDYRSKEKCIEILDEIQNEIMYTNHYSHSGVQTESCQNWKYGLYQMPEDK